MQKIVIDEWKTVYTNADTEDVPKEALTSLKNMLPKPGKLEKTFGFGDKFDPEIVDPIDNGSVEWDDDEVWTDGKYWIDSTLTKILTSNELEVVSNMATYVHGELICPNGSGIDYAYIAYFVNSSTYLVSLIFWNGEEWKDIDNLLVNSIGSYYHKRDFSNPIVQADNIIRFLPGNVALADASNESKGIWIGWIERDFFNELYTSGNSEEVAAATKDYQKGFYVYDSIVEKPTISFLEVALSEQSGGDSTQNDTFYFKFTYFYDGNQETLLSENYAYHKFTADDVYLQIIIRITKATHNKRITGIGIYKSDTHDGIYYLATIIDLTRTLAESTALNSSNGGYGGLKNAYIPALSTYSFTANPYRIKFNGGAVTRDLDQPAVGTGTTLIGWSAGADIAADYWDGDWDLEENDGGWASVASDSDGSYTGEQCAILAGQSMTTDIYIDALILLDYNGSFFMENISENVDQALHLESAWSGTIANNSEWAILHSTSNHGYFANTYGDESRILYRNFWNVFTDGAAHPVAGEASTKVNGKFAAICKGRLFQWNIILDPGGKNEVRADWASYSEVDQYDVNPVSNTWAIPDREGGDGTGIGVSFGSVIFLKPHGIFKLKIVDPADDTSWILTEAKFDRGNIAPKGYVQIGHDLYICSIDGVYLIDLNVLAASDDTPLIHNRISEPINDIYQALNNISEKPNIISVYDHINTEIIFQFTTGSIWAYNITTKFWREIDTSINMDAVCLDETASPIIYDDSTKQIYSPRINELVGMQLKTKSFRIGVEREETVRLATIAYRSATALTVNLYVEGGSTAVKTGTLAAASIKTTARVNINYPCKVFVLEIIDSVNGSSYTDIFKAIIE
jgi:hypothetical protein